MAASYQNDDQARKTNFSTTIFGEKLYFLYLKNIDFEKWILTSACK